MSVRVSVVLALTIIVQLANPALALTITDLQGNTYEENPAFIIMGRLRYYEWLTGYIDIVLFVNETHVCSICGGSLVVSATLYSTNGTGFSVKNTLVCLNITEFLYLEYNATNRFGDSWALVRLVPISINWNNLTFTFTDYNIATGGASPPQILSYPFFMASNLYEIYFNYIEGEWPILPIYTRFMATAFTESYHGAVFTVVVSRLAMNNKIAPLIPDDYWLYSPVPRKYTETVMYMPPYYLINGFNETATIYIEVTRPLCPNIYPSVEPRCTIADIQESIIENVGALIAMTIAAVIAVIGTNVMANIRGLSPPSKGEK